MSLFQIVGKPQRQGLSRRGPYIVIKYGVAHFVFRQSQVEIFNL